MSLRTAKIIASIRRMAPYLAIELILPGGSMIALILWLLRNRPAVQRRLATIACRSRNAVQLVAVLRPSTPSTV